MSAMEGLVVFNPSLEGLVLLVSVVILTIPFAVHGPVGRPGRDDLHCGPTNPAQRGFAAAQSVAADRPRRGPWGAGSGRKHPLIGPQSSPLRASKTVWPSQRHILLWA